MSRRQSRRRAKRRRHAGVRSGAHRRFIAGTGLTLGATLGMGATAQADTYEVDRLDDDTVTPVNACTPGDMNDCMLRGALGNSNASTAVDDVITFEAGLTGSITLGGAQLDVTDAVQINGPGVGNITVSGNSASRVFHMLTSAGDDVMVSDLTLTGAASTVDGGAIYSYGPDLTVADSVVTGNTTSGSGADGAGIYSGLGSLTVQNSTIGPANNANDDGGAIFVSPDSPLTIERSTISGNSAVGMLANGGGVYTVGPTLVESSTISGNSATGDFGGGIWFYPLTGPLTIRNSTISNNSAAVGGGLYAYDLATVNNTILADNTATSYAPDAYAFGNSSFTLFENGAGVFLTATVAGSNIVGQDPALMALAANGGPTMTHALPATSVAVDCGSSGEATDQRGAGFPRPVDHPRTNSTATGADGSDIGAFELPGSVATGACTNNTPPAPPTPPPTALTPVIPTSPTQTAPRKKKCKKKRRSASAAKRCKKKK